MVASIRPEIDTGANSLYAAGLQKGESSHLFDPKLESEYLRNHLRNNRMLIRMACGLAALVTVFRAAENTIGGNWPGAPVPHVMPLIAALVICASLALAWIAWSRAFERLYLPVAR